MEKLNAERESARPSERVNGGRFINHRVVAVIENEWSQLIRNRVVVFTTFAPPFLFVALALTVLYISAFVDLNPDAVDRISNALGTGLSKETQILDHTDAIRAALLSPFLPLFMMLPIVVPLTVASYSIIGEKQNRSLEALLSTPIRTWELLLAKSMAAAIPGIAATWYSFAIFLLASRFLVTYWIYNHLILSPTWLLAITLLTPIFTMFAVALGIIISSRAKDPQSAQQLGSLIVLPLVGIMIGQVVGVVNVTYSAIVTTAIIIGVLDVGLLALAVRLFRREAIFTGWK
jgi:ABC-2 type transport system permease protein